jgi:hypothetical protein
MVLNVVKNGRLYHYIHTVWNLKSDSSDVVRSRDGNKTLTVPGRNKVRYTRYYSHRMGLSVLLYPAVHDYFVATMFSNGVRVSRSACTSRFHKECSRHKSIVTYSKVWRVGDFFVLTTRLLPLCEPVFRAQDVTIGKYYLKAGVYKIRSVHVDVMYIYDMTPYWTFLSHAYIHVQRILQSQK